MSEVPCNRCDTSPATHVTYFGDVPDLIGAFSRTCLRCAEISRQAREFWDYIYVHPLFLCSPGDERSIALECWLIQMSRFAEYWNERRTG